VVHAAERVYFGTYTKQGEGIYTALFDQETGTFSLPELAARATNPTYLALAPDGRTLYAAIEHQGGAVAAFHVGPDGKLIPLNEQSSQGAGACHLTLDPSGQNLFVANYSSGSISQLPVQANGALGDATKVIAFSGSGPHQTRQSKAYSHFVGVQGRRLYSCDLGSDKVWCFQWPGLEPADPPFASLPPGSGPRHMAFSPNGRFAYVNGELGLTVSSFAIAPNGALHRLETVPVLPEGVGHPEDTTSAIVLDPTGRWLLVPTRRHDSISVFEVREDGRLRRTSTVPSIVKTPRSIAFSPNGKWLIAAGQTDNVALTFAFDPTNGQLTPTQSMITVPSPVCVLFDSQIQLGTKPSF